MTSCVTKLHTSIKEFSERGGASLVEVNAKLLIFGGADRQQTHFQDLAVYNSAADSLFVTVRATGDVPMPRSGHSVVAYGKYMFLFGGIDFAEEAVFNDLYILNTDTFEWGYVGEAGAEVIARNSHSMGIISDYSTPPKHYLVVYGGASPEHGPLGDTLYAELPELGAIDPAAVFVEWKVLPTTGPAPSPHSTPETVFARTTATAATVTLPQPGAREMHGTACFDGKMYISGGRDEAQNNLSDVWVLSCTPLPRHREESKTQSESKVGDSEADESHAGMIHWQRCVELELPAPRCAHGSAIVVASDPHIAPTHAYLEAHAHRAEHKAEYHSEHHSEPVTDSSAIAQLERSVQLVLFGGFSENNVSGDIIAAPLLRKFTTPTAAKAVWKTLALSNPITGRFGLSLCPISIKMLANLAANHRYAVFVKPAAAESIEHKKALLHTKGVSGRKSVASRHAGMLLFGGVCAQKDYSDVYMITL